VANRSTPPTGIDLNKVQFAGSAAAPVSPSAKRTAGRSRSEVGIELSPEHWAVAYEAHRQDAQSRGLTGLPKWEGLGNYDRSLWRASSAGQAYASKMIKSGQAQRIKPDSVTVEAPEHDAPATNYLMGVGEGAEPKNPNKLNLPNGFAHHEKLQDAANAIIDHYGHAVGDALPKGLEEAHGNALVSIGRSSRAQSRGDAAGAVKHFMEASAHVRAMGRTVIPTGSAHALPHVESAKNLAVSYSNEVNQSGRK